MPFAIYSPFRFLSVGVYSEAIKVETNLITSDVAIRVQNIEDESPDAYLDRVRILFPWRFRTEAQGEETVPEEVGAARLRLREAFQSYARMASNAPHQREREERLRRESARWAKLAYEPDAEPVEPMVEFPQISQSEVDFLARSRFPVWFADLLLPRPLKPGESTWLAFRFEERLALPVQETGHFDLKTHTDLLDDMLFALRTIRAEARPEQAWLDVEDALAGREAAEKVVAKSRRFHSWLIDRSGILEFLHGSGTAYRVWQTTVEIPNYRIARIRPLYEDERLVIEPNIATAFHYSDGSRCGFALPSNLGGYSTSFNGRLRLTIERGV